MKRDAWVAGWTKPAIDWFKIHSHRLDFIPKTQDIINTYANIGYRLIIRVGGIDPNNLFPTGSIMAWTGENLPEGWEWYPQNT